MADLGTRAEPLGEGAQAGNLVQKLRFYSANHNTFSLQVSLNICWTDAQKTRRNVKN
jgi:hypothetical protein